jgi:hypothetical protein
MRTLRNIQIAATPSWFSLQRMAGDVCKAEGVKGITCPSLARRLKSPFFPGLSPSFPYRYFIPHFRPVFSIHPFLNFCPASYLFCSFGAACVSRMSLSSSSASVQRQVGRFLQQGSGDPAQMLQGKNRPQLSSLRTLKLDRRYTCCRPMALLLLQLTVQTRPEACSRRTQRRKSMLCVRISYAG